MRTRAHRCGAFTLMELLVVIGIIALIATVALPSLRGLTAVNVVAQGNRQLLDDINMARNYALAQRTTVYMVFVPQMVWLQAQGFAPARNEEGRQLTNLLSAQLTSYNFVTLRTPGDQPGRGRARYLSEWKHLPEGVFISPDKVSPIPNDEWKSRRDRGETNLPMLQMSLPFPASGSTNKWLLPCIAFDYRGGLVGPDGKEARRVDELVRLTRGSVNYERTADDRLTMGPVEAIETPRGNATNNPYVRIDWITGRPRIEEPAL